MLSWELSRQLPKIKVGWKFGNAFSCNLCFQNQSQCDEAPGMFANFITLGSMLLVLVSLPFSLFFVVKVVQVSSIQCGFILSCTYTISSIGLKIMPNPFEKLYLTVFCSATTEISLCKISLVQPILSRIFGHTLLKFIVRNHNRLPETSLSCIWC